MKEVLLGIRLAILKLLLLLFYLVGIGIIVPFFIIFLKRKFFCSSDKQSMWENAIGYIDKDYYFAS